MTADVTDPVVTVAADLRVVTVAADLRAITTLAADLDGEAEHRGVNSDALVMSAPVANLEAWGYIIDARDEHDLDTSHVEDHDDDWEPPLQTLLWWTEQWRAEHGNETDERPTITGEAAYLRDLLGWAYDHEPHWEDLAGDVRTARARLEALLRAGEQVERGVPCMYDECGGVRLVRKLVRVGRSWQHTAWHCPRRPSTHTWDADAYARMVTAAHQAASFEDINGEAWCTVAYAARDTHRSVKTIRTWVNHGAVRRACMIAGRRTQFVSLDDVRDQDARAGRRRRVA